MADHMDEQPPQKRVKLRNDNFQQGNTDSGMYGRVVFRRLGGQVSRARLLHLLCWGVGVRLN